MAAGYLRDPDAITRRSFELVAAEADLGRLPEALRPVAARLVHACGMPDIVPDLAWVGDPAGAAAGALRSGATLLVDAAMVAAGIARDRLPFPDATLCTLGAPEVAGLAAALGTTRSAAAVELWRPRLAGAVVAIGNAPTALFHLLDRLDGAWPERPAAILGFPVGFVGAAESKDALLEAAPALGVPCLALRGRRGGSAMAAAAVNALAAGPP